MQRHIDFSPSYKLCCSLTYGNSSSKMSQIILLFAFLALFADIVSAEFPGRRRQLSAATPDEKQYLIEQLTNFIDQQARRKFHQQLGHLQHKQQMQLVPQQITGPGFSFELPPPPQISKGLSSEMGDNEEPIQFAVDPFNPRYYEQSVPQEEEEEIAIDEAPIEPEIATTVKSNVVEGIGRNKILIPSPMHVHESSQSSGETQSRILHRAQQKQQQLLKQSASDVSQKPLQMEFDHSNMNLYLVALIAGISCAFSTGLIALGLMYWTLKKKVKSADACDYASCDYGVVGPRLKGNVDPQVAAGDKKLAHSAQMFHYQHQKNQIIAMENRNGAEISHNDDQDNDSDENENDFTVYECPGLAGVGNNMEVKNPLFSEETPASTKTEKAQPTNKTTK